MTTLNSIGDWNIAGNLGQRLMPHILGCLTTISDVWRLKVVLLLFFTVFLRGIRFGHLTSCFVFLLFAMELLEFNLTCLLLIDFLDLRAIFVLWCLLCFLWYWGFLRLYFSLLLLDELDPLLVFVE